MRELRFHESAPGVAQIMSLRIDMTSKVPDKFGLI
jgi:hypothetical protein